MPTLKKATTLHELLVNKLMALYDIETQIIKALPKMAKKAMESELKKTFENHLQETKGHVQRLEECFDLLGLKAKKLPSEAIRGLVKDANWVVSHVKAGPALDTNLVAAAQYVEHYEMAAYSAAIEWSKLMNHNEVAELLQQTYEEEVEADGTLTSVAESTIWPEVAMGMSEERA